MSFSYDLTTDIGLMRFDLGDTAEGAGVRADGSNLSDEELQMVLTREGSTMAGVAAICEMLARDWQKVATSESIGPRSYNYGQVAAGWAVRAAEIRATLGGQYAAFSFAPDRVDGYSQQADL